VPAIKYLDRISITILLLAVLSLWAARAQGPIDLRYDAGVYYLTGEALGSGFGYRLLSEPGNINAIQYPPLLPTLVALVQLATNSSDPEIVGRVLRLIYFVFSIVYTLSNYALARTFLTPCWAVFAAAVPTLHVHTVFMSDLLFAELPYSLFTILFFLSAGREASQREFGPRFWVAAILAPAAFFLRTSGLALLGAWIIDNSLRGYWRRAAIGVLISLLSVGGWQGYVWAIKHDSRYENPAYAYQRAAYQFYNVGYIENVLYVDPFQPELGRVDLYHFASRAAHNLRPLIGRIGETLSADRSWGRSEESESSIFIRSVLKAFWLGPHAVLLFAALSGVGLLLMVLRRQWLIPAYALASLLLIVITPWPAQFLRYLSPLAPVFGIAAAVALSTVTTKLRAKPLLVKIPVIAISAVIVVIQVFALSKMFKTDFNRVSYRGKNGHEISYHLFFYNRSWKAQDQAIDWLLANASPEDIVVTSTPHWVFIRTGLKAVMPPFEADPVLAQQLLDSVPTKYLVIDSLGFIDVSRRYGMPVVETFSQRWKEVYTSPDQSARVFQRR
jgi:hypothetical protein